jgi:hypothetical protein
MTWLRNIAAIGILALSMMMGCHRGVVATTPLDAKSDVEEIYPSKRKIWVPGKVSYRKGKYFWRNGRYKAKSYDKPVLVAAHWKKTPRGYVWKPARWRKF